MLTKDLFGYRYIIGTYKLRSSLTPIGDRN